MNGYISPEKGGSGSVPIESRAEIYRDPEHDHEIAVETESNVSYLGIADVTVSRKKGSDAPVVFRSYPESIEVRNQGNSNGVVVRTEGDTEDVSEGFSSRIRRDAVVELGYQTELRLTVEREAQIEVQDGDYVSGNKTEVTDSVVNRSNISGGQPADDAASNPGGASVDDSVVNRSGLRGGGSVDDSIVNRSNVGGTDPGSEDTEPTGDVTGGSTPGGVATREDDDEDQTTTRNVCEVHEVTYTGQICPECADSDESKFCLYCGGSIPALAQVCPECGEQLPDR